MTGKPRNARDDEKRKRLAAALRDNLKRRKARTAAPEEVEEETDRRSPD